MIVLRGDDADTFAAFVNDMDDKWTASNQYEWSVPQIARYLSGDRSVNVRKYSIEGYSSDETRVAIYTTK